MGAKMEQTQTEFKGTKKIEDTLNFNFDLKFATFCTFFPSQFSSFLNN